MGVWVWGLLYKFPLPRSNLNWDSVFPQKNRKNRKNRKNQHLTTKCLRNGCHLHPVYLRSRSNQDFIMFAIPASLQMAIVGTTRVTVRQTTPLLCLKQVD